MNDRCVSLLDNYEIEVLRTWKGRGAILCETEQGTLIFKEYIGQTEKLNGMADFLTRLREDGFPVVEQLLPDKSGAFYVRDRDGFHYILKTYPEGRECNIKDSAECRQAMETLAKLHLTSYRKKEQLGENHGFPMEQEFEKHNRELKRVLRYLKERGQKNEFERYLLQSYDYFYQNALQVTAQATQYHEVFLEKPIFMCHGDFQYHNIQVTENGIQLINFEKCVMDHPVRDLYLFLRKIMEKSNWSQSLGQDLLQAYLRLYELDQEDFRQLYFRLAYPEKFWKIVNFYYNTRKSWIPLKNLEKLGKVIAQEQDKLSFLNAYKKTYDLF